jgi:hypothetical protein
MADQMKIGGLTIAVTLKDVKNIHLSVKPPLGAVSISAPLHMSENAIRAFAIGKLGWIKQQQDKLQAQVREAPREYLERESHYVWGRRCLLKIVEHDAAPHIELRHNRLVLSVRGTANAEQRAEIVERWYREQLRSKVMPMIAAWQQKIGVDMQRLYIQRMKTRWGSCNPQSGSIRLNTDLAKKPTECLEYILVHELVHLIEPTHSQRFVALMDKFLPNWPHLRDQLNALPVRHADWEY